MDLSFYHIVFWFYSYSVLKVLELFDELAVTSALVPLSNHYNYIVKEVRTTACRWNNTLTSYTRTSHTVCRCPNFISWR